MELPLDHFRLIGVSPSATPEGILRAFQLRLDKTPDHGFTFEALTQRAELLRLTADLLTDAESRKEYENQVLKGSSGLEFASNREVAALLLLWESGSPKEAFKFARKALLPPQTPALGSSRESDLTLLAALTSRDAAIQEQNQRCYASASEFLQEGIQILQRMGKLSSLRKELEEDLISLLPYRILDFLSRDLNDFESHKKGISMLENLIIKRGGLEGRAKSEYDKYLNQNEFEVFFQQIRPFLTVQEQIDLFISLQKKGSTEAGYLAFLSLTAIGFSRRKPEKIFEARKIIRNLNLSEIDSMPIMGCIDLLLADIKQAEERFLSSSDEDLKDWINNYEGEKLEALCSYCRNWLENEVLIGFRDIDIQKIDLDSWFEDREIQEFIEKLEKKSYISISKPNFQAFAQNKKRDFDTQNLSQINLNSDISNASNLPLPGGIKNDQDNIPEDFSSTEEIIRNKSIEFYKYISEQYSELKFICAEFLKDSQFIKTLESQILRKYSYSVYVYTFLILFGFGLGFGLLRNNIKNNVNEKGTINLVVEKPIKNSKPKSSNKDNISESKASKKIKNKDNKLIQIEELKVVSPTIIQVENLITQWLDNKSRFLSGKEKNDLSKIVKAALIKRLNQERDIDIKRNIVREINAKIESIELISKSSSRISVLAKLKYSEKITRVNGQLINETSFKPFLKVRYILGYSNKSWKLVDYVSGV
ncbi:MAG: molecular chaperone DnaJ [Prochlorococcus sp. SP3034]|nr:molecular chaperone DnaJ [Prochlorococcus sp. SP3034]